MKKISSIIALSASAVLLTACGGGSSSSGSTASTANNLLDALQGTYVMACSGDNNNGAAGESSQGTAVITTTPGSAGATVSMHLQNYTGSTNCTASTRDTDVTVNGQVSAKGTTKNYLDAAGRTVTGNVVTFTYTGMTLALGNLTGSLPVAGVTTDVAYVLTGNNLYVSKGNRGADGLGDSLTKALVKQ